MKLFFAFIDLYNPAEETEVTGRGTIHHLALQQMSGEKERSAGSEVLKKDGEGLNAVEDSRALLDPQERACFKWEKQLRRACFNLGVQQRRGKI